MKTHLILFLAALSLASPMPTMAQGVSGGKLPTRWDKDPYTTQNPGDGWQRPGFDAAWESGPAPFGQGYAGVNTPWTDTASGIWLRRAVTIPAKLVVLAKHDEDVEVYVNGVPAPSAPGLTGEYARLPVSDAARAALRPGPNLIAVHCRQTVGGQVIDGGIAQAP